MGFFVSNGEQHPSLDGFRKTWTQSKKQAVEGVVVLMASWGMNDPLLCGSSSCQVVWSRKISQISPPFQVKSGFSKFPNKSAGI